MSLKGKRVKIIVSEPYEWEYGNLFGTVIYDDDTKITVKLPEAIKGEKITSNLLELCTRYENETFKPLAQNYSATVGGALIEENSDEFDYIIIGSVGIIQNQS